MKNMNGTIQGSMKLSPNTPQHANHAPHSGAGSVSSPIPENNYPSSIQRQLQQRQLQQQHQQMSGQSQPYPQQMSGQSQPYPQQMSGQSQPYPQQMSGQSQPRYANNNMTNGNMQNSNMTNIPMINSNISTNNRLNAPMVSGNMQNSNMPNYGNGHNKSMNNEYPMNSTSNISNGPPGAYNQNHQAYNNNMNTMNNMTPMSVNTSYHANNAPRSGAGSVNSPMPENNYSPNLQQRQLQQRQLQQQYSQQQYPQQMSGQSQQHLQSPPRYANGNKQSGNMLPGNMQPGNMQPGNKQPGNRSAYPTNNGTGHSVPLDPNTNNMYFSSSSQTLPNPQYIPQVGANMNNRVPNGPYPPGSVSRMENSNKQMLNPPPSKTSHKNTDNTSVISASSAKKRGCSRAGLVSPNDLCMPKEENGTQPMNRAEKRHVKEEIEDRPVCGSEVQYNEQNLYQNTKSGMNTSFYLIF